MTVNRAGTVGFLKSLEVPALDNAGGSFTLAGAGYVDALALGAMAVGVVAQGGDALCQTHHAQIRHGTGHLWQFGLQKERHWKYLEIANLIDEVLFVPN